MDITGRKKRFVELAQRVALSSSEHMHRHGAVLVRGNNVVNVSSNRNAHARFGQRFRRRDKGHATQHAELGCLLGLDRTVTSGSTMYVVRVNRAGELRNSKPCHMCLSALEHCGVRKVYYTTNDGTLERLKI